MKRTITKRAILLAPGFSQVYESIAGSENRFNGFQTAMAQVAKPLKRFSFDAALRTPG
jgi:hypothetical protein